MTLSVPHTPQPLPGRVYVSWNVTVVQKKPDIFEVSNGKHFYMATSKNTKVGI